MRIIRIAPILLVAMLMVFPKVALADETFNPDTKINNTVEYFSQLLAPETAQANEIMLAVAQKEEKEKTPDDDDEYDDDDDGGGRPAENFQPRPVGKHAHLRFFAGEPHQRPDGETQLHGKNDLAGDEQLRGFAFAKKSDHANRRNDGDEPRD